jgi:hypothetical protein
MSEQATSAAPAVLTTKHGVQVAVGQLWRDCDKRMNDRRRYVIEIDVQAGEVRMGVTQYDESGTWVSVRRMHKHSTGWELVA